MRGRKKGGEGMKIRHEEKEGREIVGIKEGGRLRGWEDGTEGGRRTEGKKQVVKNERKRGRGGRKEKRSGKMKG